MTCIMIIIINILAMSIKICTSIIKGHGWGLSVIVCLPDIFFFATYGETRWTLFRVCPEIEELGNSMISCYLFASVFHGQPAFVRILIQSGWYGCANNYRIDIHESLWSSTFSNRWYFYWCIWKILHFWFCIISSIHFLNTCNKPYFWWLNGKQNHLNKSTH